MKKRILILAVLLAWINPILTRAQLNQVLRLELPLKEDDYEDLIYDVTPLEKQGLLVSTQPRFPSGRDGNVWNITRYDTTLHQIWANQYKVDHLFEPVNTYLDSSYYYVLLAQPDSKKFKIFRLDLITGDHEWMDGNTLTYIYMTEFKVLSNTAFIGGIVNYRPVVLTFNFFDKRTRVLPALYEPRTELNHIQIDPYQRISNVLIYTQERNHGKLSVRSFDYSGKVVQNVTLESPKEKGLITGRITSLNEQEKLIMGHYAYKNLPYSQGLFMAKLNGNNQEYIKYFQFNDFKNFFNFMKPRRQEKIKERILKKRQKGKEMLLHYKLLMHDIIETSDQYILVAEAFYPQYRSGTSYGYAYAPIGNLGRSYGDRVFEGYHYTHAVICGFDKSGNLLWDNSFEIQNIVNYNLREMVEVAFDQDKIILTYPEEGEIHTKVIRGNDVLKEKEKFKIATNFEEDKVIDSDDVNIDFWYNKYFISWGTQEIQGARTVGSSKRRVFYLNKITYDANLTTRQE
ncbi:hypothetical protein QNI19_33065 [Cytophagaceae bacterium DM2B3-1]|uniref:Uncharacterized protein n=2 Tax=Xanthocytophaga TaxID=3078918 RepID=A0AAE3QVQ1_9BACT|nr:MULTISPECIES: hypothetical protein [Xanthocytophaga]MDJ1472459.1 hypothetical protein [Xanthocytophaga flavus]MDJ1483654.1 hypothetical protein [Xanthocytophaga flavus]MDJ1497819.1 hypothetical protein [Xanthocytophaga flavus]MDJ1499381.1 hypothetical protein [Xanthocytophaga agilis]